MMVPRKTRDVAPPPAPPRRKLRRRTARGPRYLAMLRAAPFLLCVGALAGTGIAFHAYLNHSPRFQMKTVVVEGALVLREDFVVKQSGITRDDTVVSLDIEAAQRRIASIPYVRSCRIERQFPDRLIIKIVEREPFATLLVGNRSYEVDEEGVVLRELEPMGEHEGPMITLGEEAAYLEPGTRVEDAAVRSALALWKAFSPTRVAQQAPVSEILARAENNLSMYLEDVPFELRWGRADFARQARNLELLWEQKGGCLPCLEYLDLRFENDLVCK